MQSWHSASRLSAKNDIEANVSGVLTDTLYYKAFVENAEGLNYGAPKHIELEGIESPGEGVSCTVRRLAIILVGRFSSL